MDPSRSYPSVPAPAAPSVRPARWLCGLLVLLLCTAAHAQDLEKRPGRGGLADRLRSCSPPEPAPAMRSAAPRAPVSTCLLARQTRTLPEPPGSRHAGKRAVLLEEKVVMAWEGDAWVNATRYLYTYDEDARLLERVREEWEDGAWESASRTRYTYDAQGHLTEESTQDWENGWVEVEEILYDYEAGRLTEEILRLREGNKLVNFTRLLYSYDAAGRLEEEIYQEWAGGAWVDVEQALYSYDDENRLVELIYSGWEDTKWVKYFRSVFSYDSEGRLTEEVLSDWDGSRWVNVYRARYTYDGEGNLTEWVFAESAGSQWINQDRDLYSYDDEGNRTERVIQGWRNGQWVNKKRQASTYEGDVRAEDLDQVWEDGGWVNQTQTHYSFIVAGNAPPVALQDAATVAEDGAVSIDVLANDSDPEGSALTPAIADPPEHGTAEVDDDGTITYTPDADFSGADGFTYEVDDGDGKTATAAVTVSVTPVNDAPVAVADAAETDEGVPVDVDVLQNDSDVEADALALSLVTLPQHGTAVVEEGGANADGPTLHYTPAPGFSGTDRLTYEIDDGNGGTARALVTVTVTPAGAGPVARQDTVTVAEDEVVSIDVLANDTGAGDAAVSIVDPPEHGTAGVNDDGTITYTPEEEFSGDDHFAYEIDTGDDTAQATVTVTVTAVNDAPAPAVITAPEEDATLVVGGAEGEAPADPATTITIAWDEAEDAEGDPLTYRWELALDEDFEEIIATVELEAAQASAKAELELTYAQLAGLLDEAGVALGDAAVLYHRVIASDGEQETASDVFRITLVRGTLVAAEGQGEVPQAYALGQNYPNPFNPATVIEYALPEAGAVRLAVYDALGREVRVLVDARQGAGRYRVSFEAAGLPSGLYLYRLEAARFHAARTMLVMK